LEQFGLINREENYNEYFERKPKNDPIKNKKEQNKKKKLKAIQQKKNNF
jgi:ABC-type tungstate transport system permease subunit